VDDVGVVAEVHPVRAQGLDPAQRVPPGRHVAGLAGREPAANRNKKKNKKKDKIKKKKKKKKILYENFYKIKKNEQLS